MKNERTRSTEKNPRRRPPRGAGGPGEGQGPKFSSREKSRAKALVYITLAARALYESEEKHKEVDTFTRLARDLPHDAMQYATNMNHAIAEDFKKSI